MSYYMIIPEHSERKKFTLKKKLIKEQRINTMCISSDQARYFAKSYAENNDIKVYHIVKIKEAVYDGSNYSVPINEVIDN